MKYAVLSLDGIYRETAPQVRSLFAAGRGPAFRHDAFLARVERILRDKRILRVLVDHKVGFHARHLAGLEAVRRELDRLKAGDKEVVYYARSYAAAELYLASACSWSVIHPLGSLEFLGLSHSFVFLKGLLKKHKIEADVIRRGRYKSAGDPFRVDSIDRHNREQYERILDNGMDELREKISGGLAKRREDLDALLEGRALSAAEAVEEKWVRRSATREDLLEEWKKEKLGRDPLKGAGIGRGRKRIAVLFFEGLIIDGASRVDPLSGQAIGADSYLPVIEHLAKRRSVKGVVFRINSPGGSSVASQEIGEAIRRLAAKKPVVVSMGEVAGSGGYWIAAPAERIFAERTTLTGSIGVISMVFSADGLLAERGVTAGTLRRGEHADAGSPLRRLTAKERSMFDARVERVYRAFVETVAASRKRSSEEIRKIAEGRVWAGEDALGVGLVDEVGGLSDAIEHLKKKLALKKARIEFHPRLRYSLFERLVLRNARLELPLGGAISEAAFGLLAELPREAAAVMLEAMPRIELFRKEFL